MKFKCCEWALAHLVINSDDLTYCCASFDKKLTFKENYHGELIDIDEYIKNRELFIEQCKQGNFPEVCKDCPTLEERDWDETPGFIDVSVSNRTKCSCNCTYCIISSGGREDVKKDLNTRQTYDVRPLLNQFREKNMFKPNCHFIIGGGECAEYPKGELKWLVDFVFEQKGSIEFLSAGIKFSDDIKNALRKGKSKLKVSVDAGTKKVYEQVKRVKGYDAVWKNLKKYIEASKKNPNAEVTIKYIIIPNVNDNMTEATEFIKRCNKIGCTRIEVNVEFFWMNENWDKPISDNLREVLLYFQSQSNLCFSSNISSHVRNWLEKNLVK
ncbi:MAG: radical SAM protein [Candidatus Gastranaerophilales bacterium]|nr:radical SAM protein [Candidatus Gastranaerophilales bacterium]